MIDTLRVYRGRDYALNSKITVRQPTLGEICDFGEQKYFGLVRTICATPADRKVEIWDSLHIYWEKVDEFDLFVSVFPLLQKEDVSIIFGDMDMASFKPMVRPNIKEVALINKDKILIDRAIYFLLTDYLREIHRMKKNDEIGYDNFTRDIMIEDDREEMQRQRGKPYKSLLLPLISTLTNCSDFKYRWDDVWTLPISVFMDSVERINKTRQVNFTMQGIYSGCVDAKKISRKDLNWMADLSH